MSLPASYGRKLNPEQSVIRFYWTDHFTYAETTIHGSDRIYAFLAGYVATHKGYSAGRYWWRSARQILRKGLRYFDGDG